MAYAINQVTLKSHYQEVARTMFGKELKELNPVEINCVLAHVVKTQVISPHWRNSHELHSNHRVTKYFSMEFLMGRTALDMLNNTGLLEPTKKIFKEEGIDIMCLETMNDPALGNGGLGRLAACFLDSAATQHLPLFGVGLYYKYGLFKQIFDNEGNQIGEPDVWDTGMEPWFEPADEEKQLIKFQDTQVWAVPYEVPIVGYNPNPERFDSSVFPLTVWKAEPIESVTNASAAAISDWLYPNDKDDDGKILRMRQEYFFVSAELQRLFKRHISVHGNLDNFEDYYCFQMNDTHPVFGCLEFIRLLKLEEYGKYTFDEAFEKATKCWAYTNHTVMPEALEKWDIHLFKNLLPDIYKVVEQINDKLIKELSANDEFSNIRYLNGSFSSDADWKIINQFEAFGDGMIHMAHIACYVAFHINGVAKVHTDILEKKVLANWYELCPQKFSNKTNGITPRRWMMLANPELSEFLDRMVGPEWRMDMSLLTKLEQYKNNQEVLKEFAAIKRGAKKALADEIYAREKIRIDPESIFDIQVKRIHEYKRQLMNALRIIRIYEMIKAGKLPDFPKTTFIIGGKAAESYEEAKDIIRLIKDIQGMINNDPAVKDKMQVVFLTNFNVSYGESIYPAANFSEQISTAGTEAAGTGNMKFMANGAPTIGTWDGANIEIIQAAGKKNNYRFGKTVDELEALKNDYQHNPSKYVKPEYQALMAYLKGERGLKRSYWRLANSLLPVKDRYFVMVDLEDYVNTSLRAFYDYAEEQRTGDLSRYTRKAFKNITFSGFFSSDRTVKEYADEIWHIEPVAYEE